MTAGYMVYNRFWEQGCLQTTVKADGTQKAGPYMVAICGFPDPKFSNGVAFIFPTRKAANRAITRAMKAGYFAPRDDWQIIRLVK